jgi:hypothetical protein
VKTTTFPIVSFDAVHDAMDLLVLRICDKYVVAGFKEHPQVGEPHLPILDVCFVLLGRFSQAATVEVLSEELEVLLLDLCTFRTLSISDQSVVAIGERCERFLDHNRVRFEIQEGVVRHCSVLISLPFLSMWPITRRALSL